MTWDELCEKVKDLCNVNVNGGISVYLEGGLISFYKYQHNKYGHIYASKVQGRSFRCNIQLCKKVSFENMYKLIIAFSKVEGDFINGKTF